MGNNDFEKQWNDVMHKLKNTVLMSRKQKVLVTGAGAAVYQKYLHDETPFNPKHVKGVAHIRDSIHFEMGKTYSGKNSSDGSTDVGFAPGYFTQVAYIVNNGARKMSPKELHNMHFMERAIDKSKEDVLAVEQVTLAEVLKHGTKDSDKNGNSSDESQINHQ